VETWPALPTENRGILARSFHVSPAFRPKQASERVSERDEIKDAHSFSTAST
jgi:hypothetical protein